MPVAYYNEFDPYAAQWLRNLIDLGAIAPGDVDERSIADVDERSIADVDPADLLGYDQCHFFAGLGVWSYALRQAGWPDDRPVWTGSCPCQPFSAAGLGAAFGDPRHLWPVFERLIAVCRPATVFGEQVASGAADAWADLVQDDVEALGYAFAAVPFPAAGVGAPQIRDRLYWLAHADIPGLEGRRVVEGGRAAEFAAGPSGLAGPWADAEWIDCLDGLRRPAQPGTCPLVAGPAGRVVRRRTDWRTAAGRAGEPGHRAGRLNGYGNALNAEAARVFIATAMPDLT